MMEQEFGKLIAAVERIAVAVEKLAAKDVPASTPVADALVDKKSEAAPKPKKKSGDNRVTAEIGDNPVTAEIGDNRVTAEIGDDPVTDDGISYDEMHKVMFEIARVSPIAKKMILPVLNSYGYNHVQQVKPEHYAEIHGKLLTIAARIAKGEIE